MIICDDVITLMFHTSISQEWLNGSSLNLVWTLCHYAISHAFIAVFFNITSISVFFRGLRSYPLPIFIDSE
jgi:hypothetical protein